MEIQVSNSQNLLSIDETSVQKIVAHALRAMGAECDEISIQFVTTQEICELHETYFDDPTTTDCITFPVDPPGKGALLGEVFVCPETALTYSKAHGTDPKEETILYIIHGILHLLGYDDMTDEDEPLMREKERFLIQSLKNENLLSL